MTSKHYGKFPVNSRITIDYEGEKPKVKFGYPDKKSAGGTLISLALAFAFVIILLVSIKPLVFNNFEHNEGNLIHNCSAKFYSNPYWNKSIFEADLLFNMTIFCDGKNQSFYYQLGITYKNEIVDYFFQATDSSNKNGWVPYSSNKFITPLILLLLAIIAYGIIIFIAIGLYKLLLYFENHNNWYKKRIPKINRYLSGRGYYVKFTSVSESKILEIPLFSNVFMDYEAQGEFSRYLKRVEVREHPFTKCLFKIKGKGKLKSVLKEKKKKNSLLWNAKFIFSDVPKSGYLEVRFN